MATSWTREQVEAFANDWKFEYQRIELPYGFATRGRDRSATANRVLPPDLGGKTVLDVGCKYGYYCFEALRRGARRVVGVDASEDSLHHARRVAECRGDAVEFQRLNVESERIPERFDYVLCLNVLHHPRDPFAAIDNLMAATRETLALEIASFGRRDRHRVGVSWLEGLLLRRSPVVYVATRPAGSKRATPKTLITPAAYRRMLRERAHGFDTVEVQPSPRPGRYIVIARRSP